MLFSVDVFSQFFSDEYGDLCVLLLEQCVVDVCILIQEVVEIFCCQVNQNFLVIFDEEGCFIGIVYCYVFIDVLFWFFVCDLFLCKLISCLMSDDFFVVEFGQILQQVSCLLISCVCQCIEEDFIVICGGYYVGMGWVIDVFRLIIEEKFQQVWYVNLFILFFGNVLIQ